MSNFDQSLIEFSEFLVNKFSEMIEKREYEVLEKWNSELKKEVNLLIDKKPISYNYPIRKEYLYSIIPIR